jgi:ribosomal protein L23
VYLYRFIFRRKFTSGVHKSDKSKNLEAAVSTQLQVGVAKCKIFNTKVYPKRYNIGQWQQISQTGSVQQRYIFEEGEGTDQSTLWSYYMWIIAGVI